MGEAGLARRGLLVLVLLALAGLPLPAASGAGSPASRQAEAARAESSPLRGAARAAWLSVISLDTRLEQSQAALLRLGARSEAIARARSEAELELRRAERTLRISERRLAVRLRLLYEQGEADPLAVVLGSSSMGEALEGLDGLDRVAAQDRQLVDAARAAREKLLTLTRVLAAHEAAARQAEAAAAATAVSLAVARAERPRRRAHPEAGTRPLTRAHERSATTSRRVQPPPPAGEGRKLSVTATGYALSGKTATGVSVGWGIVAVDPAVIALGTRISIPGYGEGVAADTGGAVRGARIDLWFPTRAEALAWGSRTITITLV